MKHEYEAQSKLYIIPQDGETREDLLCIDRFSKEDLRLKHRLIVNSDWEMNTITNTLLEALIKVLYSQIKQHGVGILSDEDDNAINFYNLLEIAATHKANSKAEKTGNINIKFITGKDVDAIISDNVDRMNREVDYIKADAAYSYPDDMRRTEAMVKIDRVARKELADKYSIVLPHEYDAIAAGYVFLENMYRHLVSKVIDKPSAMINFNDLIEFHIIRKGDNVDIHLRPGMGAKLIIKSDETTEEENDLSDD